MALILGVGGTTKALYQSCIACINNGTNRLFRHHIVIHWILKGKKTGFCKRKLFTLF